MLNGTISILVHWFGNKVIDNIWNQISVGFDTDHVSCFNHNLLKCLLFWRVVILNFVDFAKLSNSFEKFIWGACFLRLEESKPENLSITALELRANIFNQAVVDDIFEIYWVKFIGPWMKNLKAFMIHVLSSESFNVFLNEFKVSLVSLDWIWQVILNNCLLLISKEWSNSFDAWCTLKILWC